MYKEIQVVSINNTLLSTAKTWRSAVKEAKRHFDFKGFALVKGENSGNITLVRWYIPTDNGIRVDTVVNK